MNLNGESGPKPDLQPFTRSIYPFGQDDVSVSKLNPSGKFIGADKGLFFFIFKH